MRKEKDIESEREGQKERENMWLENRKKVYPREKESRLELRKFI